MEWIKVICSIPESHEYSVDFLIGEVVLGEWDEKEKGYVITFDKGTYFVKQDEVESASCAYCDNRAEENSCICAECLIDGMEVSA